MLDHVVGEFRKSHAHGQIHLPPVHFAVIVPFLMLALIPSTQPSGGKAIVIVPKDLSTGSTPEKVMVAMASRGSAKRILRGGARIAGRLASDWFAVYVETPREEPGRIDPQDFVVLQENIRFAKELGASKGSASVNTRLLEQQGFIERVSKPGDRRDYYRISPDLFERTMRERLARWHRLHDVLMYGLTASDLSPGVRARIRDFEAAHNNVREVIETALARQRNRRKR